MKLRILLTVIFIINCSYGIGFASAKTNLDNTLSKEQLCYLPANELLALFKERKISPVDLLQAQIERIEKMDLKLHAVSIKHYEEALAQAKESELRYKNGNPRALEGLTCAVKDDIEVIGWQMTMGSLIRKNTPAAKKDSAVALLLRDAGLVMHVQTNVPEYYCNLVTWNILVGTTRNPWNIHYTPGGSSGGSAAALAAGFTTLATGSDMGGSIRFPAAMAGLYGFKPPYGRVPTSLVQYESIGPMARTFEDLNLFQNILSGPSPKVISALRPKLNYPAKYGSIKGWRIAYDPMHKWGIPVDKTVQVAMEKVVHQLQVMGAEVEEVDLGLRAKDFETYARGIFSSSIGPFCFNEAKKHPNLITPYIKSLIKNYGDGSPQCIAEVEEWIDVHHYDIQKKVFLKNYKAIIMPTMCTPYIKANMGDSKQNTVVRINGKPYSSETWTYSFTWPWNLLGQYPVINIPISMTPEGIPIGMQIVSDTHDDLTVFQVAEQWSMQSYQLFRKDSMPKL